MDDQPRTRKIPSIFCPSLYFLSTMWWFYWVTLWAVFKFGAEYERYRNSFAFLLVVYVALVFQFALFSILEYMLELWGSLGKVGRVVYVVAIYDIFVTTTLWFVAKVLENGFGSYEYFNSEWPMAFGALATLYTFFAIVAIVFRRFIT